MFKKLTLSTVFLLLISCAATAIAAESGAIKWMKGDKVVYLVRTANNFIILYDRSDSMKDIYDGTVMTELAAERKILVEKNATLPDMNWMAGIYSFTPGSGTDNLTVHYPMQKYDKKSFSYTISKMPREPKGATLLQQGLFGLESVLATLSGRTVVFLFTDGQYTPIATLPAPGTMAERLASQYDTCFVVINSGADKKGLQDITAIASASECSYIVPFSGLLKNPEWMTSALFSVVDQKPDDGKDMIVGYEWENILFDFDKAIVKPQYFSILSEVSMLMKKNPQVRIILAGHTDNIGPEQYNIKLSHRRAAAVRDYLVTKEGIAADRITLNGFGYTKPIADNKTREGRAKNRRVKGIFINL